MGKGARRAAGSDASSVTLLGGARIESGREEQLQGRQQSEEGNADGFRTAVFPYLSDIFLSEKYSDMVIKCRGGTEYKAHRAIVCPQSPFFDAAMTGAIKQEGAPPNTVNLPGEDPDTLLRFLEFLYTGTYQDGLWGSSDGNKRPAPAGLVALKKRDNLVREMENSREDDEGESDYSGCSSESGSDGESESEEGDEGDEEDGGDEDEEDGEGEGEEGEEGGDEEGEEEEEEEDDDGSEMDLDIKQTDPDVPAPDRKGCDVLFTHLHVYLMAERYDVPALRKLSRNRFLSDALMGCVDKPEWPGVVDEVFSTTRSDDDFFRQVPSRLVASKMHDAAFRLLLRPVMRKHGDLALRVMDILHFEKEYEECC